VIFLFLISSYTFAGLVPGKGTIPHKVLNKIFPRAQVSHARLYSSSLITSGDM
jgi:hypothetical protein